MLYCEKDFDIKTIELAGIFVKKYRCFENQFFSLHPLLRGCVSKKKGRFVISLKTNDEFDLFREKKINVITLCGKTGSGKSTLVNLILWGGDSPEDRVLFFIDSYGHIALSRKSDDVCVMFQERYCLFSDEDRIFRVSDNLNAGMPYDNGEDGVNFWYTFIYRYLKTPDLFSFENDAELFSHYEIHFKINHINDYLKNLFHISFFSYENYAEYPLYVIIAYELQDVTLEHLRNEMNFSSFEKYILKINKLYPKLKIYNDKIKEIICSEYDSSKILKSIPYKSYKLLNEEELGKRETLFYKLLDQVRQYVNFQESFSNIFFSCPLKIINQKKRYLGDLSDGERQSLKNRYKIYASLSQVDEYNGCLIYFDEPENFYHPELARLFWKNLVKEFEFTKKYILSKKDDDEEMLDREKKTIIKKKFISVIVCTHSPFLLSDLFRHNILALEKNKNGIIQEVEIKNTFAGNIAEILCDSMFMKGMIGAFAEDEILRIMRQSKKNKDNAKLLIEQISDPILKNALASEI